MTFLDPLAFSIDAPAAPARPVLPTRRLLQPSPDYPDDYILELDFSHGLGAFCVCPRQWENLNIHSRESNYEATALTFGRIFHACEELRLRHGNNEAMRNKQRELIATHYLASPVAPGEYRTGDRLLAVMEKYNTMFASDGWPENVVELEGEKVLERAFKVPLTSIEVNTQLPYPQRMLIPDLVSEAKPYIRSLHILLTGRIDAIIRNSNMLFVVDHKTTSRDESEVTEAFHLSLQTRGYAYAARALGIPVAGCIINSILVRPPAKTERAAKPREEFNRHTYFYSAESLDEYESDARAHVENLVHCLTTGFFPQTSLSFRSPCPRCDYHDNCRLPRAQRSADLQSQLYRDVTWSPINE